MSPRLALAKPLTASGLGSGKRIKNKGDHLVAFILFRFQIQGRVIPDLCRL